MGYHLLGGMSDQIGIEPALIVKNKIHTHTPTHERTHAQALAHACVLFLLL